MVTAIGPYSKIALAVIRSYGGCLGAWCTAVTMQFMRPPHEPPGEVSVEQMLGKRCIGESDYILRLDHPS